jgi:flagellar biosynthesis chaperone FliJ
MRPSAILCQYLRGRHTRQKARYGAHPLPMHYPLQSLLELRISAEKAAEEALARAVVAVAECERELNRLQKSATSIAQKRRQEIQERARVLPVSAEAVLQEQAFLKGLADALTDAANRLEAHRREKLEPMRLEETTAMEALVEARRQREALEKHRQRMESQAHQLRTRRAEDAASDLAIVNHTRGRKD